MTRIPEVPKDMPFHHQQFFHALKKVVDRLSPPDTPPGRPTNLTVKPMPGGNEITFTGGDSSDGHLLLVSPDPTWDPGKPDNHVIDLGLSTHHVHVVGQAAKARHYWIVATRGRVKSDPPTGPVKGTTLALNTPAANSKLVPLSAEVVRSTQTGRGTPLTFQRGRGRNIL